MPEVTAALAAKLAAEQSAERERLATQLAYDRGRESARIDARLLSHDQHFEAINGSIAKMASRVEALGYSMTRAEAAQERRDAVNKALAEAVQKRDAAQLTTRTFVLGMAGFFVALGGLLAALT